PKCSATTPPCVGHRFVSSIEQHSSGCDGRQPNECALQGARRRRKVMRMTKSGLTVGFLLLAGTVALANPQERVVTLPGAASTNGVAWQPKLMVREQKSGNADRPVLSVHGFTFPSSLSVFWKLDGRSWADALNEAGFSVWGFDFAGYGGARGLARMGWAYAAPGAPGGVGGGGA